MKVEAPVSGDPAVLAARLTRLEEGLQRTRAQMRATWALAGMTAVCAVAWGRFPSASAQLDGADLEARVAAVEAKTAAISDDPATATLTITGRNVYIQSGSGSTNDGGALTGAGNLIIGYNTGGVGGGSHNLILGDSNSYSSYGCVIGGTHNTASGSNGMLFGHYNTVQGAYNTVSGGYFNNAGGWCTAVSSGFLNRTVGSASGIGGGSQVSEPGWGWARWFGNSYTAIAR